MARSIVYYIWNFIPHILQTTDLRLPSNLKYGFTYALHLWHLNGVFTSTTCTYSEPNGVIQAATGYIDFFGTLYKIAEVGLINCGLAS